MSTLDDLPEIVMPDGLPAWLVDGFSGTDDSAYGTVEMATGHDRKRRLYRSPPIRRQVQLLLTELQTLQFESWFENDLYVGERRFSARVRDMGPGHVWYAAQFASPYEAEFMHWAKGFEKGAWRISAELILYGVGSDFGPELTSFKSEISIPLNATSAAYRPVTLSAEVLVPLIGQSRDVSLSAEVDVPMTGSVSAYGVTAFYAEVQVGLTATSSAVRTARLSAEIQVILQ